MNVCSDQCVTVNICKLFPIPIHKCMHVTFKKHAQSAGFEPARGDPNGFRVHRLNLSATTTTGDDFLSGDRPEPCSVLAEDSPCMGLSLKAPLN